MRWRGRTMSKDDWKELARMLACYWLVIVGLPLMVLGAAWIRGWTP